MVVFCANDWERMTMKNPFDRIVGPEGEWKLAKPEGKGRAKAAGQVGMAKLKIELKDIGARRVVVVPRDLTLMSLHDVIQSLFGWEDCHLWKFSNNKGRNVWQPPDDGSGFVEDLDPADFSVEDMLQKVGDHAEYEYDFGDIWRHKITRMTDPKPNVEYGCVKSEGPDGEEDSRFSLGDEGGDEEDRPEPTLDEINGRMPSLGSLSRLGVGVQLADEMNGGKGPNIMDILNAKSEDDLRESAMGLAKTEGLSAEGLKEELHAFLSSDAGLKASIEGIVISVTEPYFNALKEAVKSGSTEVEYRTVDEFPVFCKCPITHVQRSGTRNLRLFVASEVREMWQGMSRHLDMLHAEWDAFHALADAAVRLYGGVTVHEFAEMLRRFYDYADYPEEMLEALMGVRASCWDSFHFVEEGTIYGDRFNSVSDYRDFARKRDVYPRWETSDLDEFLNYADEEYFENTPQREALVEYCMRTFGDSRNTAEGVVKQIQESLSSGASSEEIADEFSIDFPDPKMAERKVAEIEALIRGVRDNMRLAEYNGNTYSSLSAASSVVRDQPKVGRNDPCPCGSGKKFKKCCGKEA